MLAHLYILAKSTLDAPPDAAGTLDGLLHTLCKCFHHTVAAYMPDAMAQSLKRWLDVFLKLLEAGTMAE